MIRMAEALQQGTDQPRATFAALEQTVQDTVGAKLFTVMEIIPERGVAVRSYTSLPDAYPVSGEKPLPDNHWSDIVLARRESFVANSIAEIAEVFPDHELIRSLGCESCLNLPVVIAGTVRGTLNILHAAGHFTPELVVAAEGLKPAAALAILLAQEVRRKKPLGG